MAFRDAIGIGDVPWRRMLSTGAVSCMVAAPLALGLAVGHAAAGGVASLGAYLFTVSHLTDRRPIGLPVDVSTVLLFGLAGGLGALAGRHLWLLLVMAAVWATFQAVADVAAGALRMPVAMSALGLLLSAIGGGAGPAGSLWRGVLFLGGTAWLALFEIARQPPWRSSGQGTRHLGIGELGAAWPRARGFALLLAVPTTLAAAAAGTFQISHGAWMATTVLRVLRPDAAATIARSWRRVIGTATGAVLAALLLAIVPRPETAVIVLVVAFTAMQLVGPARYGIYTFCLTLIALQLGSVGHPPDLGVALIRVVLTLIGAAIAVASGLAYDHLTTRGPSSTPPDEPRSEPTG